MPGSPNSCKATSSIISTARGILFSFSSSRGTYEMIRIEGVAQETEIFLICKLSLVSTTIRSRPEDSANMFSIVKKGGYSDEQTFLPLFSIPIALALVDNQISTLYQTGPAADVLARDRLNDAVDIGTPYRIYIIVVDNPYTRIKHVIT
jgi:hypothetical protein